VIADSDLKISGACTLLHLSFMNDKPSGIYSLLTNEQREDRIRKAKAKVPGRCKSLLEVDPPPPGIFVFHDFSTHSMKETRESTLFISQREVILSQNLASNKDRTSKAIMSVWPSYIFVNTRLVTPGGNSPPQIKITTGGN
jgi:hypothetical protein